MKKTIRKCGLAFVALLLVVCTPACRQDNREPQSTAQSEVAKPDAYAELDLSLGLSTEMIDEGAVMGREMPRSEARTNITLTKNNKKFTAEFDDDSNTHNTADSMLKAVVAIQKQSDATLYLTQVDVKKEGKKSFRIQSSSTPLYKVANNTSNTASNLEGGANTQYKVKVFLGAALKDNKTIAYGVGANSLSAPTAIEPILASEENAEVKLKNAYGNVPFVNEDWKMLKLEPSTRPDRNKMLTLRMDPKDNIKLKPQGSLMVVALKNETDYTHTITEMGFYSSALTQRGHYVYNNNSFDYKPLSAGGSETMGDSDWVNFKFTSDQLRTAGFGDKAFSKDKTCYVYFWAMSPLASTISQAAFTQALFRTTRYDTGNKHEREYTYPAYASIGSLRGLANGKVSTTKASINLSTHRPHPLELAASLWSWGWTNGKFRFRRGDVGGSYVQSREDMTRLGENNTDEAALLLWNTSGLDSKSQDPYDVPTLKVDNTTGEFVGQNNNVADAKTDTYYFPSIPELYGIFPVFSNDVQNGNNMSNRAAMKQRAGMLVKTQETILIRKPQGGSEQKTYVSFYMRNASGHRMLCGLRFLEENGSGYSITPYTSAYKYEWINSWTATAQGSPTGKTGVYNKDYSKLRITARLLGGMNEYTNDSRNRIPYFMAPEGVNVDKVTIAKIMQNAVDNYSWWTSHPMKALDIHRTYPAVGYGEHNRTKVVVGGYIQIFGYLTRAGNNGGHGGGTSQNKTWQSLHVRNFTTNANEDCMWVQSEESRNKGCVLLMRQP